jgi:hypothetical protein
LQKSFHEKILTAATKANKHISISCKYADCLAINSGFDLIPPQNAEAGPIIILPRQRPAKLNGVRSTQPDTDMRANTQLAGKILCSPIPRRRVFSVPTHALGAVVALSARSLRVKTQAMAAKGVETTHTIV